MAPLGHHKAVTTSETLTNIQHEAALQLPPTIANFKTYDPN